MDDETRLHVGDQVVWRQRHWTVRGFAPMSIEPPRLLLEHVLTRELVQAPRSEIRPLPRPR